MKDIYELKAQKYKLKYEKLLQELKGGAFQQRLQQINASDIFEFIKNNNNINSKLIEFKQKLNFQNGILMFFQKELENLSISHLNINNEIQKIQDSKQTQNNEIVKKLMFKQNNLDIKIDSTFDNYNIYYKSVKH